MGIRCEQALDCFRSDDLIGLGMEADGVRRRLHPEGVVTYLLDRAIDCGGAESEDGFDRMVDQVRETIDLGGTGVRITGGLESGLKACRIAQFEEMLRSLKQRFPSIWIEALSASEMVAMAGRCGLGLRETMARLRDAGLDSTAGDGANLLIGDAGLDQDVRDRVGQRPSSVREWVQVHRTAHELGMRTTATLIFGAGETMEQRVDHLEVVRRLQEETGGFASVQAKSYQPRDTAPGGTEDEPTAVESLKTLAIARMFLNTIENLSGGGTQGLKVLQMGLRFGANDVGPVSTRDNRTTCGSEEDVRRIIRDAGFQPVQRDTLYRTMFLN